MVNFIVVPLNGNMLNLILKTATLSSKTNSFLKTYLN